MGNHTGESPQEVSIVRADTGMERLKSRVEQVYESNSGEVEV
jgi:hypothetical protein